MERAEITDPFFRSIFDKLTPEIDRRMIELAAGSAGTITGDTKTVAEKYADQTAYLRALNDVLKVCAEIELDRYGAKPDHQT